MKSLTGWGWKRGIGILIPVVALGIAFAMLKSLEPENEGEHTPTAGMSERMGVTNRTEASRGAVSDGAALPREVEDTLPDPTGGAARLWGQATTVETAGEPSVSEPVDGHSGVLHGAAVHAGDADRGGGEAGGKTGSESGGERPSVSVAEILEGADMSDPHVREQVVARIRERERERRVQTVEKATRLGIPLRIETPDGGVMVLRGFEGERPIYRGTFNRGAAISSGATQIRGAPLNLQGSGITVGVWDGGWALSSHREFGGRVTRRGGPHNSGNHATHVAGTVAASGLDPAARGMAPAVRILSYDYDEDLETMPVEGAASATDRNRLSISNHSYGELAGYRYVGNVRVNNVQRPAWLWFGTGTSPNSIDPAFGRYAFLSQEWDSLAHSMPYYAIFRAAGNDRGENPGSGHAILDGPAARNDTLKLLHIHNPASHPKGDGVYKSGYDTISYQGLAKNIITIGAVTEAASGSSRDPSRAGMSTFSSWGPTDDGRIKPDLVAKGVAVYSCGVADNSSYYENQGTSMSSPSAAGSAALLVELYKREFANRLPRSCMLKALLIHTADDLGRPGPDYVYGWGLINVARAAGVIMDHKASAASPKLIENQITASQTTFSHTFEWDGVSPIRATLAWLDPPGPVQTANDSRTRVLVHNLDLVVTGPEGLVFQPYVMPFVGTWTPNSMSQNATTGKNNVDNVEQVYIAAPPQEGGYTATVSLDGALTSGSQVFSLVVTGGQALQQDTRIIELSGDLSFGRVEIGAVRQRSFTIANIGNDAINVSGLSLPSGFSAAFNGAVAPGAEVEVPVSFNPSQAGNFSGSIRVLSNATSGGDTLPVSGSAIASSAIVTLQNGVPVTGLSGAKDSERHFRIVVPSGQANLDFQMTGSGEADIYVRFGNPCSVSASGWDYRPMRDGSNEEVAIMNPEAGTWYAMIRGRGSYSGVALGATYEPPFDESRIIRLTGNLDFVNIPVGATASGILTIHNDGNLPLTVSGIALPEGFSGGWSGQIPAGASRDVVITFSPAAERVYQGMVTVTADQTSGTGTIQVFGIGIISHTILQNGVPAGPFSGEAGSMHFYWIDVPDGQAGLRISTSGGEGWATIYARHGQRVSVEEAEYSSDETDDGQILIENPAGGRWYILLHVRAELSGMSLTAAYQESAFETQTIRLAGDLNFGAVRIHETAVRNLEIHNDGNTAFSVSGITLPRGFTGGWSGAVEPGAMRVVPITFAPQFVGKFGGEIAVTSTADEGSGTRPIEGAGIAGPPDILERGVALAAIAGGTDSERYYRITVPESVRWLSFASSGGAGDADLYVRRTALPTRDVFDHRSHNSGNNETVHVENPAAGEWYVMLHGRAAYSSLTLLATFEKAVPLGEALDASALTWTTGGDGDWLGQDTTSYDGAHAARSGSIGHNQASWLQTTVEGPGVVTFWWKVSSEANRDMLSFLINGEVQSERISGETDWRQMNYILGLGPQTLRWRYVKDAAISRGMDAGFVDRVTYERNETPIATPSFSPDGGTYVGTNVQVIVACATEGVTIRYTTDGSEPTEASPPVESGGTVSVRLPGTLQARAWKHGMLPSAVKGAQYAAAPPVATPVLSPDGGAYVGDDVQVLVSCATAGATLRYTTDGSEPTENSAVIPSGGTVSITLPGTLRVRGWKQDMNPSAIKRADYARAPDVLMPVFDRDGGEQSGASVEVIVTCPTPEAIIRFTLDGTDPTESSPQVFAGSPVTVPLPGLLKARAWKVGMNPSPVKSASFVSGDYIITTPSGPTGSTGGYGSVDGTGDEVQFNAPVGVAIGADNIVYVADTQNHTIRKMTPAGVVTTLAGLSPITGSADDTGSQARFFEPRGLAVDAGGNIYVADKRNHTIRRVTPAGVVSTFAGQAGSPGSANGIGSSARFRFPGGVAVDAAGNLYVADTENYTIRKITPAGVVTTLAGSPGSSGSANGTGSAARFLNPAGVAVDTVGNVYVADTGNHAIRKVTPAGVVTTYAGQLRVSGQTDGTWTEARFHEPAALAIDADGNLFVADQRNHIIRKVTPAGVVSTPAGLAGVADAADGAGSSVRFNAPAGIAVDANGNIYIADTANHRIRKGVPAATTVNAPTFSPPAGDYVGTSVQVTLSSLTDGATVRYTLDGSEPDETNLGVASGGIITVPVPGTLTARAFRQGMEPSSVNVGEYRQATVVTPSFSPHGGEHPAPAVQVTIGCATDGATIRYTTDGSDPTETSAVVPADGLVHVPVPGSLRARAYSADMLPSPVQAADYSQASVAMPTFDPDGRSRLGSASVTVVVRCATEGALIRYTLDGSDPTGDSPSLHSGESISVLPTQNLRAKAWKDTFLPSPVKSAWYFASEAPGEAELEFKIEAGNERMVIQPDGKVVVGGGSHFARILPDGTQDVSFSPGVGGGVSAIALQPDGGVLVSGSFVDRMARIRPDGTRDEDFAPRFYLNQPYAIAVQPDGKILVGGGFWSVNGKTKYCLARLNPDGTLDDSFHAPVSFWLGANVYSLVLQPDGRIIVAGAFETVAGHPRDSITRLNPDGSLDMSFTVEALQPPPARWTVRQDVRALALQPDGKLIIGGVFESIGGHVRNGLARLNPDGSLDAAFAPAPAGGGEYPSVSQLALLADGRILVSGSFHTIGGAPRVGIAMLNPDGTADELFAPNKTVNFVVRGDGRIYTSDGYRLGHHPPATQALSIPTAERVEWLRGGSSPEADRVTFELSVDGSAWAPLGDGTRIAGGWEMTGLRLGGEGYLRARAFVGVGQKGSGILETTESFDFGGTPHLVVFDLGGKGTHAGGGALAQSVEHGASAVAPIVQPHHGWDFIGWNVAFDVITSNVTITAQYEVATYTVTFDLGGKGEHTGGGALVQIVPHGGAAVAPVVQAHEGWAFTGWSAAFDRVTANLTIVARYAAVDGSIDTSFDPNASGGVISLAVQADEKILVGGFFTNINGQVRNRIARLNPDGTLDIDFDPDANSSVWALAVQPDGKILAGGGFRSIAGQTRNYIARLNLDGTLDASFNPDANSTVEAIAVQPDGKILIGGRFRTIGGEPRDFIARLNHDGELDTDFAHEVGPVLGSVLSLAVQPDGKILIGGWFVSVNGEERGRIARLHPDGTLDDEFHPFADSVVYTMVVQPDGKILVAGDFTQVNGVARSRIARLNPDGTLDTGFNAAVNREILRLALQADGRIVIGGRFGTVDGQMRNRIARLNTDGTLDTGFNPNSDDRVRALAMQANGGIIVGGDFNWLGGETRNRIARLMNDDAIEQLAVPGSARVEWLRSGSRPEACRVVFDLSTDNGSTWSPLGDGEPMSGVWELSGISLPTNGTVRGRTIVSNGGNGESIFESSTSFSFPAFTVIFDLGDKGERVGGGELTQTIVYGGAAETPLIASAIEHMVHVGWDTAFDDVRGNLTVTAQYYRGHTVTFNLDGKGERIGGGQLMQGVPDGGAAVVPSVRGTGLWVFGGWDVALDNVIADLTVTAWYHTPCEVTFDLNSRGERSGGGELAQTVPYGGRAAVPTVYGQAHWVFTGWIPALGTVTQDTTFVAQYRPSLPGVLDAGFSPAADRSVGTLALQANGKMVVGGLFSTMNGASRNGIARLNPDGTLEIGFDPDANREVRALAVQSDGKILLGGEFAFLGDQTRNGIARLNPDGTLENLFAPNVSHGEVSTTVDTLALQSDGKILVGGNFKQVDGQTRNRLARLNPDGTLDIGFNPNADNPVRALALQVDGKILVGGNFSNIGGVTRNHIARLNQDGTLDSGFNPNAGGTVLTLVVQADGKILVGGGFTSIGGQTRNRIARLNPDGTLDPGFTPNAGDVVTTLALQADGKIILGGDFTSISGQPRNNIARLTTDGSLDTGFNPNSGRYVKALSLQADGKIVIGGSLTSMGGQVRNRIARLMNDAATEQLSISGSGCVEWLRGGSSPEADRVTFELSVDGSAWAPLGDGTRIAGGWEMTGLSLAGAGQVRARAFVNGGAGIIESVGDFYLNADSCTVMFDLTDKGTRMGGGALIQTVPPGGAAIPPLVEPNDGYRFDGWDTAFDVVTDDLAVTALLSPLAGTFARWLADQDLSGAPADLFRQRCPVRGVAHGFRYAFGTNLPPERPLLNIRVVDGRVVVETPAQDGATMPYVEVRLRGSTNLVDWTLPLRPAQDTTGKPAGADWSEPDGDTPSKAFFRLEAELK